MAGEQQSSFAESQESGLLERVNQKLRSALRIGECATLAASAGFSGAAAVTADMLFNASPASAAKYNTRVIHKTSNLTPQTLINRIERALPYSNYNLVIDKEIPLPPSSAYLYQHSGGFTSNCNLLVNPIIDYGGGFQSFSVRSNWIGARGQTCYQNVFRGINNQTTPANMYFPSSRAQTSLNRIAGEVLHSIGFNMTEKSNGIRGTGAETVVTFSPLNRTNNSSSTGDNITITRVALSEDYKIIDGTKRSYTEATITEEIS